MALFFITILVFGLVIAAMAVGVIAGRPPIKGSCGGMGALGVDTACDLCGGNPQRCEDETRSEDTGKRKSRLFYSADK
jgi:hypothetical protein